jgi:hypothetical protein
MAAQAKSGHPTGGRSSIDLARDVASDLGTLVRKELELARHELIEALVARIKAAAAGAGAGAMLLIATLFFGLAATAAIARRLPFWAASLIVAGGFTLLAVSALFFALVRVKRPPLAPEETRRTVKEDVEWARAQLKR